MITKIYALIDNDSQIRYIGKTIETLNIRLSVHLSEAKNSKKDYYKLNWLRKCIRENKIPRIILMTEVEGDGCLAEIAYIASMKKLGFNLVNGTLGGDGLCNPSNETREKMRLSHLGKKLTKEHKEQMSLSQKERHAKNPMTKETKEKIRQSHLGWKHTEESKIKIGFASLGRKCSLETREKIGKANLGNKSNLGRKLTEEHKANISKSLQKHYSNNTNQEEIETTIINSLKGD